MNETKIPRQKRIQQKQNHIKKQYNIAKTYCINNIAPDELHRYAKVKALNCGNPDCIMCGNPRKFFNELTIQEKKFKFNITDINMESL